MDNQPQLEISFADINKPLLAIFLLALLFLFLVAYPINLAWIYTCIESPSSALDYAPLEYDGDMKKSSKGMADDEEFEPVGNVRVTDKPVTSSFFGLFRYIKSRAGRFSAYRAVRCSAIINIVSYLATNAFGALFQVPSLTAPGAYDDLSLYAIIGNVLAIVVGAAIVMPLNVVYMKQLLADPISDKGTWGHLKAMTTSKGDFIHSLKPLVPITLLYSAITSMGTFLWTTHMTNVLTAAQDITVVAPPPPSPMAFASSVAYVLLGLPAVALMNLALLRTQASIASTSMTSTIIPVQRTPSSITATIRTAIRADRIHIRLIRMWLSTIAFQAVPVLAMALSGYFLMIQFRDRIVEKVMEAGLAEGIARAHVEGMVTPAKVGVEIVKRWVM
ncbi:hypothetical protein YB2330_000204 [Saitoella coloradoensis]